MDWDLDEDEDDSLTLEVLFATLFYAHGEREDRAGYNPETKAVVAETSDEDPRPERK